MTPDSSGNCPLGGSCVSTACASGCVRKPWHDTAVFHAGNEKFYKDIVEEVGKLLGGEAYKCDDGTVVPDPLALKVVPVLQTRLEELERLRAAMSIDPAELYRRFMVANPGYSTELTVVQFILNALREHGAS